MVLSSILQFVVLTSVLHPTPAPAPTAPRRADGQRQALSFAPNAVRPHFDGARPDARRAHASLHAERRGFEASSPALEKGFAPTGLYPIWEGNGWILPHRRGLLTTSRAEFGVANVVQLGLRPSAIAMRAPNGHIKMAMPSLGATSLHVALNVGVYAILAGAADGFFSPSFATSLSTFDDTIWAIPVSLAATWAPLEWVAFHNKFTVLGVTGRSPVSTQATVGDFFTAEVLLTGAHSFSFHVGDVGLWNPEFRLAGASYRYASHWLEVRLGYFYRHSRAGMQRQPLLSAGFIL